jgi:hypothetical protein
MPRYVVTTHRAARVSAISARAAMAAEPDVTVVNSNDPHMVTIEASEDAARQLQSKLKDTHFVEPEIRRGLC